MNVLQKHIWYLHSFLIFLLVTANCSNYSNTHSSEEYHYDSNGRLIYKVSPDGNPTTFDYNDFGLLTEINYQDEQIQYKSNGICDGQPLGRECIAHGPFNHGLRLGQTVC